MTIPYLTEDELEERRIYRIRSRNLRYGVWVADRRGFIGVREKFGDRYPFLEYHWDADSRYGTARPVEALDAWIADGVPLVEDLPSRCRTCGSEKLEWVVTIPFKQIGRRMHKDRSIEQDHEAHGNTYSPTNRALLEALEAIERAEEANA